jgi:methylated-DNA-[protein]-cysteine S-methyltransferase
MSIALEESIKTLSLSIKETQPVSTIIQNDHIFEEWLKHNNEHSITVFASNVYKYVSTIPLGKISTYKMVAIGINNPHASRAVGTALKKNPFAPKVPCHRVICSNYSVGGFMGSKDTSLKVKMLKDEGIKFEGNKICNKNGYRQSILHDTRNV